MKNNRYTNWFFAAAVVVAGFSMAACEDEPDKYEVAGGKPTLKYVRVPDPAAADSLRPSSKARSEASNSKCSRHSKRISIPTIRSIRAARLRLTNIPQTSD